MRLLDPTDAAFVTGTEEDRKKARDEWHKARFVRQMMSSNLPEIRRSSLAFHRFGIVEDTTDGRLYRARRDGVADIGYVDAAAYYFAASGVPVLLEPAPGPKTKAELEQRQAARMERRNALKPRPAWMR